MPLLNDKDLGGQGQEREENLGTSPQQFGPQVGEGSNENSYVYQKVKLDRRVLAGFFIRLVAYLIDVFLATRLAKVFTVFLGSQPVLQALVGSLIFLAYFILSTGLSKGQTLGKMILGLKVIKANGDSLTWTDVLVREGTCRYILKVVPLLYLLVLFTDEKQSLADLVCDTLVIKASYQEELFYKEDYVYPNYQTSYIKN